MDIALLNRKHNMSRENMADFGPFQSKDYQAQLYMSDYFIEALIQTLYYEGWLEVANLDIPIDTTAFDVALLGQLTRNGFSLGQPCQVYMKFVNEAPDIIIREDTGLYFSGYLSFDFSCKRDSQQEHYTQLFTLLTQKITFNGKIDITDKFTVKIHISNFKLNIDKIVDSTIGNVDVTLTKILITLLEAPITLLLNTFFGKGLSLQWLMKILGLDFVVLTRSLMKPMDNYFIFFFTPDFNLDQWVSNLFEKMELSVDYIFERGVLELSPETLTKMLAKIKDEIKYDDPEVRKRIDEIINQDSQDITYITG